MYKVGRIGIIITIPNARKWSLKEITFIQLTSSRNEILSQFPESRASAFSCFFTVAHLPKMKTGVRIYSPIQENIRTKEHAMRLAKGKLRPDEKALLWVELIHSWTYEPENVVDGHHRFWWDFNKRIDKRSTLLTIWEQHSIFSWICPRPVPDWLHYVTDSLQIIVRYTQSW